MIHRRQTVPQRKKIKAAILSQDQINRRHYYAKAREEIGPHYMFPRLGMTLFLLVAALTLSYVTAFRDHMTYWIVSGELPIDWINIAIYVVGFLTIVGIFIFTTKKIDDKCEAQINARFKELMDQHNMVEDE